MRFSAYMPDESFGDDPQGLLYSETERGQKEKRRRLVEEQRRQQIERQNEVMRNELLTSKNGPPASVSDRFPQSAPPLLANQPARAEERFPQSGMAMLMDQEPQAPPPQQEQAGPPVPTREALLAERQPAAPAQQPQQGSEYSQMQRDLLTKAASLADPNTQPFFAKQRENRSRTIQQLMEVVGGVAGAGQRQVEQQRWEAQRAAPMPAGKPQMTQGADGRPSLVQPMFNPSTGEITMESLGQSWLKPTEDADFLRKKQEADLTARQAIGAGHDQARVGSAQIGADSRVEVAGLGADSRVTVASMHGQARAASDQLKAELRREEAASGKKGGTASAPYHDDRVALEAADKLLDLSKTLPAEQGQPIADQALREIQRVSGALAQRRQGQAVQRRPAPVSGGQVQKGGDPLGIR